MKVVANNNRKESYKIIRDNGEVYEYNSSFYDKNGKEYIIIPLFITSIDCYVYCCRLIDQVNQIKNGEGDCIAVGNSFDKILYYLDREYGEEIRRRTLDGFKDIPIDATGKYFICVASSLMKYYYGIDKEFHSIARKEEVDPMLFTSEKDADDYIQKFTENAKSEYDRVNKGQINLGDISKDLKKMVILLYNFRR